jgi:hypothetical protein
MKKSFCIMALCSLFTLSFTGCGPSQKELEQQQKKTDSAIQADRDRSVDEANKLLQQADSADKAKQDSIAKAGKPLQKK